MRYEIETIENRRVCHPTVFFPTGLNGIYSGIGFEQKKLSEYSARLCWNNIKMTMKK